MRTSSELSCSEMKIKLENENNSTIDVKTSITAKCFTQESINQTGSTVDETKQIEILIKVQKTNKTMILSVQKLTISSKFKNLGAEIVTEPPETDATPSPSSSSSAAQPPKADISKLHGANTIKPSSKSSSCKPPNADACSHKKLMD